MGRFLRSRTDRANLWLAYEGQCAICGNLLRKHWHADHVIPYCITHQTRYEDMQPTCPVCNIRKGNKMNYEQMSLVISSSLENARLGQIGAINCTIDRFKRGLNTAALVLATGVGKTDVIRTSAIELVDQGIICAAFVVVPNIVLIDQLNNKEKINEWKTRFAIKSKKSLSFDKLTEFHMNLFENGEYWTAMTSQMFCMNAERIAQFQTIMQKRTGRPMGLFADETHLYSEKNQFGNGLGHWENAGGLCAQGTATNYRSNNVPIPGFHYIEKDRKSSEKHIPREINEATGQRRIEISELIECRYELKPDYMYSFRQAWDDKVICKIEKHLVDVSVTIDDETFNIKDLSPSRTKALLTKICRDPLVISECCKVYMKKLEHRRKSDPQIIGIVFCGNDDEDDSADDEHAQLVSKRLLRLDSTHRIGIATNNVENARKVIQDFGRGLYDTLIVKMMAGVGLDVPQCKVELDLSSVRQPNSVVQKINRISRLYKKILTCDLVATNDVLYQELFDKYVTQEGGEMVATETTPIDEYFVDIEESERSVVSIDGAEYAGVYDTDQQKSESTEVETYADPLICRFPKMQDVMSTREMIELGRMIHPEQLSKLKDDPQPAETVDVAILREESKDKIKKIAQDYANSRFNYGSQKDEWINAKKEIFNYAKKKVNIPLNRNLKFIMHLEKLEAMEFHMEEFAKSNKKPVSV